MNPLALFPLKCKVKSLVQGSPLCLVSVQVLRTDTRRQGVIPGSPFSSHTLECGSSMQSVSRFASVCDAAPREMTLVVNLEAKLRHTWVLTMRQLET